MKVYISGAITGVENYKEQFDKAQKELEKQGFEVINPTLFDKAMPENTTYEEYMKLNKDQLKNHYLFQFQTLKDYH